MATAGALLVFFWRDWIRIIAGFFRTLRTRRIETPDERMAWLLGLATIPVRSDRPRVRAHLSDGRRSEREGSLASVESAAGRDDGARAWCAVPRKERGTAHRLCSEERQRASRTAGG